MRRSTLLAAGLLVAIGAGPVFAQNAPAAWTSYDYSGHTYLYQPNPDGTYNVMVQSRDPRTGAVTQTAPSTYARVPGQTSLVPVKPSGAPSAMASPQSADAPAAGPVPRVLTQPVPGVAQSQRAIDSQAQSMMQSEMQRTLSANPGMAQNPEAMRGMALELQMGLKPQLAPAIMANPSMQKSLNAMDAATKPPTAQPAIPAAPK